MTIRRSFVISSVLGVVLGAGFGILLLTPTGSAVSVGSGFIIIAGGAVMGALLALIGATVVRAAVVRDVGRANSVLARVCGALRASAEDATTEAGDALAANYGMTALIAARVDEVYAGLRGDLSEIAGRVGELSASIRELSGAAAETAQTVDQVSRNTQYQKADVEQTRSGFGSMSESFRSISEQVDTQAGFIEENAAAVEQMTRNIDSVAGQASKAESVSETLATLAERSEEDVHNTSTSMRNIQEASQGIHELVNVISHISARTNLLSINAAIEAAHAGDSGRGFAIVAEEVRRLAEESSRSIKQITENIANIGQLIQDGVAASEATREALELIGSNIADNFSIISSISGSIAEQRTGAGQMVESMNALVSATEAIRQRTAEQSEMDSDVRAYVESLSESTRNNVSAIEAHETVGTVLEDALADVSERVAELKAAVDTLEASIPPASPEAEI